MSPKFLEYPLNDGFIDHWLVMGPLTTPVEGVDGKPENLTDFKTAAAEKYYSPEAEVSPEPLESGYAFLPGSEAKWKYFACGEDHRVELCADYATWQQVSVLAYCELRLEQPAKISLEVSVNCPVDVWVNGQAVCRSVAFAEREMVNTFALELLESNTLLIRTRQIGSKAALNALKARVLTPEENAAGEILVCLPTKARYPSRFQELEKNLAGAHLEEVVNHRGKKFNLRWADGTSEDFSYHYQVQDEQERIYVEGIWKPESAGTDIGHTMRLFERAFRVVLRAPAREYYELNNRFQVELPLYILNTEYRETPSGNYGGRRIAALKDAAKRGESLFGQIALIAQDKAAETQPEVFRAAIAAIRAREVGSNIAGLGLIGAALRGLPENLASLAEEIRSAAAGLLDRPDEVAEGSESDQIVQAACLALGGRLLDRAEALTRGEKQAAEWIKLKGCEGFQSWHSNSESEIVIAALAHLTSLAGDENLRELAAVLLDKVLFELAVHTYKGASTGTHGATEAESLKSAQMEATAGITRLIYGMGVYNPHIVGVVSLAVADYKFPTYFARIACDPAAEMLSLENQAGASTVTYRTPDYILSSVQDWRPGDNGKNELIWEASFGADTPVFTNHPGCMSEANARRPGFWLGNQVLPRVAQWKDLLVAAYNFGAEGMDFTHAHFPTYKFDEWQIQDGWAFARKGEGYLALTAARGMELIKKGAGAYRELRSYGSPNLWICQMGRAALDGDFETFKSKVLGLRFEWPGNATRFTSLRGEAIQFGWEDALTVNGAEQPLHFEKPVQNPYCDAEAGASQFEIGFDGTVMRLSFE